METYITVRGAGEAEITEKKSRFIAHIYPVLSEKDALGLIEATKKQYWDARHNCYAYVIGTGANPLCRYSDDGEPQGTAGMPMLDVLRGRDIRNTLVIVTRYFGGTLLGTGGLVRAYSSSARAGLEAAGLVRKIPNVRQHITVDYTLSGKVQYEIMNGGHTLEDTLYTDKVEFVVLSELDRAEGLVKSVVDITSGNAQITAEEDIVYADKDI